ncbi:MAG: LuxR C-terminal-related transcriptional regulator [Chloroflexota bacterium]
MSSIGEPLVAAVPISAQLALPLPRHGTVERSALLARLDSAPPGAVITILAPAGYGKTTLIGQWVARLPRAAYVRLTPADDDARHLLGAIAAAVGRFEPLPEAFLRRVDQMGGIMETGVVAQLLEALWAPGDPFVLVFDEVQELTALDAIDLLAMLVANLPPRMRLALVGRAHPKLPLARLAVEARLMRIGAGDLMLDAGEAGLMAQALGSPVGPDRARSVVERTEGWPAAMYLALRQAAVGGSQPALRGNDQDLGAYLRQELLDPLDEADRSWLRRASILDVLSGPMADAVMETTGSLARLRAMERRNLFVVPLDAARTTFRFHQLFRELLQDELEEVEPGQAPILLQRAAARSLADGAVEEAASYAVRAGDLDQLATIVQHHLVPLWFLGHWTTARRWIEVFDRPGVLEQRAAIAVLGAWIHSLSGRREDARRWLTAAERSPDPRPMPDGTPDKGPWLAALRSISIPDGRAQARADALAAHRGLTGGWFQQHANIALAIVALMDGDLQAARAAARRGIAQAAAGGASPDLAALLGIAATAAIELGDRAEARQLLDDALVGIEAAGLQHYQVSTLAFAAAARLARIEGDEVAATRALTLFDRVRPTLNGVLPILTVLPRILAIEAHLAGDGIDAARTLMRELDDELRLHPDLGWLTRSADGLRSRIESAGTGRGDHWSLTAAELRVLAYLPTHLTAREIAERLFVSPHTVKTQMMSIYGKLGASSRREAVEQAIEARLLDPAVIYTPPLRGA